MQINTDNHWASKKMQNVKKKPPADEIEAINTKKPLNNKFLTIISFLPLTLKNGQISNHFNQEKIITLCECPTKFLVLSLSNVGAYPVYAR